MAQLFTLQVTMGAAATRASATSIQASQLIIQNNAAHSVRVGDSNVSAMRGINLAGGTPGGSLSAGTLAAMHVDLQEWYFYGTQNDVYDLMYIV